MSALNGFLEPGAGTQETIRRLRERVAELEAWIKTANQFAWAHETTCPRHNADAPCNCGLDEFLARPRPVAENWKAQLATLTRERDELRATVEGLKESAAAARNLLNEVRHALISAGDTAPTISTDPALVMGMIDSALARTPAQHRSHLSALRAGIAWAYQFAAAAGAPKYALDNLSALAQGQDAPHEWQAAEVAEGRRQGFREDEVGDSSTAEILDRNAGAIRAEAGRVGQK